MKARRLWAALCLALWMLCAGMAGAEDATPVNLVRNGGFEDVKGALPAGWAPAMWVSTGNVSLLQISDEAYTGARSALVENRSANDARFEQELAVQPDTLYRFTCMVRAEGCDPARKGANISVSGIVETSPDLHDTAGEWKNLEFYGKTGKQQKTVIIMARVGGYGSENIGKAWFDDFTVEAAEETPQDAAYISLESPSPAKPPRKPLDLGTLVLPGLLVAGLLYAGLAALLCRAALTRRAASALPDQGDPPVTWRHGLALAAMALAARLALAVWVPGYKVDMDCFGLWAQRLATVGPGKFYSPDYFCDYPPGYLYVLWANGGLMRLFGTETGDVLAGVITKLCPIFSDLLTAALLYCLGRSRLGDRGALALAALYAFNPVALTVGAAWGQADALMTLGIVLALFAATEDRWQWALPLYALSVLIKPQALMLGPLGLAVLIHRLTADGRTLWRRALIGLAGAALVAVAVAIPFWGSQPADWLIKLYGGTMSSYRYASVNAANLFYLLGGNWVDAGQQALPFLGLTWNVWGIIHIALVLAFVIFLALRAWERDLLYELAALLLFALFTLGNMMHERYLFPVAALSALAFTRRRDVRTLIFTGGVSCTALINIGMVLAFDHLVSPYVWVGRALGAVNLALLALAAWTAWDHCVAGKMTDMPRRRVPGQTALNGRRAALALSRPMGAGLSLRGRDWALMLGITLSYAVIGFWRLGSDKAPQTPWQPSVAAETVTFDLGESRDFELYYYGGISPDGFAIETSQDGLIWSPSAPARMDEGECFRWVTYAHARLDTEGQPQRNEDGEIQWESAPALLSARYLRLTPDGLGLVLHEVAFHNPDGGVWPIAEVASQGGEAAYATQPDLLTDEQDTVPDRPGFYYGTYFDEIYHARTAYEHLHNMHAFEWTHPPLGKLLMMLGISAFGMTPFGWRFAGTLAGVLMLPAMYLLAKQLWKRTSLAAFATALLALDCMHFAQTRLATIDSFPVLFIMLAYLCMFRYTQMSFYRQSLGRTLIPLAFGGTFMGLAIASKWIGLYAGAGLAAIFFYTLYCRAAEYRDAYRAAGEDGETLRRDTAGFPGAATITVAWCVLWFVMVPALIYYFSYAVQFRPDGGLTWSRFRSMQESMYSYHSRLTATHPFESKWWQWPFDYKPMWYYSTARLPGDRVSTILSFGNPLVWWGGLLALLLVLQRTATRGVSALLARARGASAWGAPEAQRALLGTGILLLTGFASQYLPWVLVPRSTYIYHYFASVPFLILCMAHCMLRFFGGKKRLGYLVGGIILALALALFIGFYGYVSGAPMSLAWADAMRWLPGLWY
ncbi:MAG: glycosyltransferase family 39 protein [Oscillospiraceae bacterium]|jgi:Gpi18-like mannosyltransferase|nr:glycosyltransferase family 39 protein [Oscillospiraceae bacterium]